jgi:hypothetical protein
VPARTLATSAGARASSSSTKRWYRGAINKGLEAEDGHYLAAPGHEKGLPKQPLTLPKQLLRDECQRTPVLHVHAAHAAHSTHAAAHAAAAEDSSFGASEIMASVVSISAATEAAFCSAVA